MPCRLCACAASQISLHQWDVPINCFIFYYQNSIFRGLQAASGSLPAAQQVRPTDCEILTHTHWYTQRQRSHKLWIYLCVIHPCFFTSSILTLPHSLWFSPSLHLPRHSQGCQIHIKQFLCSMPICNIVFFPSWTASCENVWRTCQRKSSLKNIKFCHHDYVYKLPIFGLWSS